MAIPDGKGVWKGNCDAELVLQSLVDYPNYNRAVIVSGDGDFACLAHYLNLIGKLERILVPDGERYSTLLDRVAPGRLSAISRLRARLGRRE